MTGHIAYVAAAYAVTFAVLVAAGFAAWLKCKRAERGDA